MIVLKPAHVLQRLGVLWILGERLLVHIHGGGNVAFEFIHMTNLIPAICAGERGWGVCSDDDAIKVLESVIKSLLLLINDTDTKTDFVCPLKVRGEGEDGQKGLQGVLKTAVAIVQEANAVPEVGIARVGKVCQRALIGLVSLLQLIGHDVTVGEDGPCLAARGVCGDGALQVDDGLVVTLLLGEDGACLRHGADVVGVDGEHSLKGAERFFAIVHGALENAYSKPDGLLCCSDAIGQVGLELQGVS